MENKKSYYAIIPAVVRYHEKLTPNAKLLYGEITALCNEKGFCWASNDYFASLYGVSKTSISKWISQLKELGFITVELEYKEGTKHILNRYIRIVKEGIEEKLNTSITKVKDPIEEKLKDNNTVNNTLNNTVNNSEFEKLWDLYDKKTDKKAALKAFEKIKKKDYVDIFNHVPDYVKSTPEKGYRKNLATYLNGESWKNEIVTHGKGKKKIYLDPFGACEDEQV